jgi:sulfur carrier protein
MQIVLNGEPADLAAQTLAQALIELDLTEAIVATALNGDFVPARSRAATTLREGDRVEIVAPMQGG